jgi:hypothetical protein
LSTDRLWTVTVAAALSSLVVLAFFVLSPIVDEEGTVEQTRTKLDTAIGKIETLREEADKPIPTDSSLNP